MATTIMIISELKRNKLFIFCILFGLIFNVFAFFTVQARIANNKETSKIEQKEIPGRICNKPVREIKPSKKQASIEFPSA